MEEPKELLAVALFFGLLLIYRQFLVFTRTVPPEYLGEQSVVESSRNPNESAVHKSTKLDYSQGLRVGLAIRYHHYKLRNGNLYDIWELTVANAKRNPAQAVSVYDTSIGITDLNCRALQLKNILKGANVTELHIPSHLFISDITTLALVFACFISQTTVHVYNPSIDLEISTKVVSVEGSICVISSGSEIFNSDTISWETGSSEFCNEYTSDKDKGISLRVSSSSNHAAYTTTDFTQSNLVSAVASCVKHLPVKERFNADDLIAIVQDTTTTEAIMNGVVKLLAGSISGSSVLLANDNFDFMSKMPTVVSANTSEILKLQCKPNGLDRLLYWHKMASLRCLRFSTVTSRRPYPKLRLLFAHRTIGTGDFINWNHTRASLATLLVEDFGHFNTAGPLLTTDVYDFRFQKPAITDFVSGFGCVVQANEIKLVDYSAGTGEIAVRGYNIGKAKRFMKGFGETSVVPDSEGFYIISVKAKWGSDGCLYLFK